MYIVYIIVRLISTLLWGKVIVGFNDFGQLERVLFLVSLYVMKGVYIQYVVC